MKKGTIVAILAITLAVVIIAVVLLSRRRPVVAKPAAAASGGNVWSFLGSVVGGLGNVAAASWKPGQGTPSVGGSQVTGQTGNWLMQGQPNNQAGLSISSIFGTGGGWHYGSGSLSSGINGGTIAGKLDGLGSSGSGYQPVGSKPYFSSGGGYDAPSADAPAGIVDSLDLLP